MPRLLRKASQRSSPPVKEPGLVSVDDLPSLRQPSYHGLRNIVFGVQGRISTQAGVFAQVLSLDRNVSSVQAVYGHTGEGVEGEDSSEGEGDVMDEEVEGGEQDKAEARKRAGKKEKQWRNWSEVVIPAMLEPYMELLRKSESLRNLSSARNHRGCQGCENG